MKRTISIVARLAIMAMILVPAVPAGAGHPTIGSATVSVFRGDATLTQAGNGFDFPVSDECVSPDEFVVVSVCPGGQGNWSLTLTGGGGVNVTADYTVTPTVTTTVFTLPGVSNTVAGIVGRGTAGLGAWCGYSRGDDGAGTTDSVAIAQLVDVFPQPTPTALPVANLSKVTWIQSAATLIQSNGYAAAGGLNGTIHSLSSAIPLPGTGSCRTGNQTVFDVVGVSVVLLSN